MQMEKSNIIGVGENNQARYLAFGDDSQFGDTLVYAFAFVQRGRVQSVERRLLALKDRFNIPQETTLHCRVLFSGQQREKAGLGHLTPRDARWIVSHAVRILNQRRVLVRYATASLTEWKAALGDELELDGETDGEALKLPVKMDPKGVLAILAQACFIVPPNGSEGPTASQCEIIVSEDRSKVQFIGPRKRRADRMYAGFSDIGAPDGQVFQLQPTSVEATGHPLLQLADIAAYTCSHAMADRNGDNAFFRSQHDRLRYKFRKVFDSTLGIGAGPDSPAPSTTAFK